MIKVTDDNINYYEKFLQEIRDRLQKKNQNWLCAICGGTGSGKTYSAISLAMQLSKNGFNADDNIAFNAKEFMEKLNSGKLQSGDILVFEEAGVGMSSKEWFSIQNKMLSYVLQTFRHRNIGVIFTMPGLKLVDNTARMLFHCYMETQEIYRSEKLAKLKVLLFNYDSLQDKTYKMFPVFHDNDGNAVTMKHILVRQPSAKVLKRYEDRKSEYTEKLNESIKAELEMIDKKPEKKAKACIVCNGINYHYTKKENSWSCKRCGNMRADNPFI